MAEEEIRAELEALEAVYGGDCLVIEAYPPHIHVHLKPRTAEVSSQQAETVFQPEIHKNEASDFVLLRFVEATIGMRAGPQYPEEPPEIGVIDSKGLDEQRQKHLLANIRAEALELASCLMLVALCEGAVERLSSMNHPDGDCPLCLHPLLDDEDADGSSLPFMNDCIIRWWKWSQVRTDQEIKSSSSSSSSRIMHQQPGTHKTVEENKAKCPVCRKVFLAKDIEHVIDLVGTGDHLDSSGTEIDKDILHSDSEKLRRQKFEAVLRLQQENHGLIEPKKNEVLLPGVFLPQPVATPPTESDTVSSEPRKNGPTAKTDANPGSSFNRPGPRRHSNYSNTRKHRPQNSGKQARNWTSKEDATRT
ncbi:RWD domain-containing family protein [Striga asiatica]|uniref:RWD domain-containing family protein n=1 Tax=Striga asiatica TaxID=4170 RepID=A0A5A7QDT9_STRAF|nr:RWD domain-containing family protein [Striga asiatica]